ncbi:MAG: TldD/PmbA family protein [Armatimonadota bacterium]|nr:MAG: TldD/PmbA family protein [Armatimonadota bacterium]
MNEKEAREICEKAIAFSEAEHVQVNLYGTREASTRYANNEITQNVAKSQMSLRVTCAYGNKVGRCSTNRLDTDSIRETVRRAEEMARVAEPDTEFLPPPEPTAYRPIQAYADSTAHATPEDRARVVRRVIAEARSRGLKTAGSFATNASAVAVANNKGLFGFHTATRASLICTMMAEDSSGWAEQTHEEMNAISPEEVAKRAADKAEAARHPREVPPGDYTVVLEPAAVAELLAYMAWSMDAKAADEGRSAFTGKEGTAIGNSLVTLQSLPAHPECPAEPFFDDGMPTPDVTWIEQGVLKTLAYSRFWAQKRGRTFTGYPSNLILQGGSYSLQELVARVEDGLLVTRFWYIRFVDPMQLLLTGMTRDGVYRIERGKVTHAVKNLRFNESPLVVLQNVHLLGVAQRVEGSMLVPPVVVNDFTFSSTTTF